MRARVRRARARAREAHARTNERANERGPNASPNRDDRSEAKTYADGETSSQQRLDPPPPQRAEAFGRPARAGSLGRSASEIVRGWRPGAARSG